MKKIFVYLLAIVLISIAIGCSGDKKKEKSMAEVIQWSEHLAPHLATYAEKQEVLEKAYEENILELPISTDAGPALYLERSQMYLLQGKSGRPDVLEGTLEQVYSYISAGLARPVNDIFETSELKKVLKPGLAEALTLDGKLYGFPNYFNVRLLVYRKDVLDKHGLTVPKTWDELISTAKTIREKEAINGFMFTTQLREVRAFQEFMSFYFTLADNIYTVKDGVAEYTADKADFEQVFQLYKDLFDVSIDPNFKGQGYKAVDYAITGGDVGMVTVGPWIWGHLKEEPTRGEVMSNLYVAAIPIPENGEPGTYMEVKGFVFNPHASEEKLDATVDVVELFTGKEFAQIGIDNGDVSVRNDVESNIRFTQSFGLSENVATGKVLEYINWEIPQNTIIEHIQNVIYGKQTPAEASDSLEKMLIDYAPNAIPKK